MAVSGLNKFNNIPTAPFLDQSIPGVSGVSSDTVSKLSSLLTSLKSSDIDAIKKVADTKVQASSQGIAVDLAPTLSNLPPIQTNTVIPSSVPDPAYIKKVAAGGTDALKKLYGTQNLSAVPLSELPSSITSIAEAASIKKNPLAGLGQNLNPLGNLNLGANISSSISSTLTKFGNKIG